MPDTISTTTMTPSNTETLNLVKRAAFIQMVNNLSVTGRIVWGQVNRNAYKATMVVMNNAYTPPHSQWPRSFSNANTWVLVIAKYPIGSLIVYTLDVVKSNSVTLLFNSQVDNGLDSIFAVADSYNYDAQDTINDALQEINVAQIQRPAVLSGPFVTRGSATLDSEALVDAQVFGVGHDGDATIVSTPSFTAVGTVN